MELVKDRKTLKTGDYIMISSCREDETRCTTFVEYMYDGYFSAIYTIHHNATLTRNRSYKHNIMEKETIYKLDDEEVLQYIVTWEL